VRISGQVLKLKKQSYRLYKCLFLAMQLKEFLREEVQKLAFREVSDSESIAKSRLLDSITLVDLAVAIEDEFKIKIPFNEITEDNFDSIDLIAAYLHKKGITS
jgi:acyl carrier protein